MAKGKKSPRTWWVLSQADSGVFRQEYSGPDKKKARETAAALLKKIAESHATDVKVSVALLSRLTPLDPSDLESSLSKDAF